ncbi:helicase required for RNAi-mediated heterochromatin assembly 1 [Colletotrichum orchidophilum]|uniref:Helicase required for RNAi-mediated heterochromatin assembly 1 n=1 Tax=Colletotrichum orchidophilum TaxID=1209926 RepID=A0A1G4AWC4_9PEZI|nr:helicase required for RNAi-mediated heterochromatin assembly 1 [Colletotrichum orchidophilum]OHE93393.1 helicase required for RNAi-mediated heterochromatin assembly 1 [Colletotrichum orchidophilum]
MFQKQLPDCKTATMLPHSRMHAEMSWCDTPELPRAEEIMKECGTFPKKNGLNIVYPTKGAYLQAQYDLLRFEGVEPLRRAVQEYKSTPEMADSTETCIYTDGIPKVFIGGVNIIRLGVMIRVTFSAVRARQLINWPASQRLVPGTIVALSPASDNFRTECIVAVVTGRYDELIGNSMAPPPLDLEFPDPRITASVMEPDQEYVMVEARSNYFEAVRHVLEGLKKTAEDDSPFDKYFIGQLNTVGIPTSFPPSFDSLDISALHDDLQHPRPIHIPIQGDIPSHIQSKTRLDQSQLLALQRMIARELAIVQGPPGTGKTHTSMAALKVLLSTQRSNAPIIVTAQKNDTVDELLTRCHKLGVDFVRLGGQAKDEAITSRTLFNLRMRSRSKTWCKSGLEKSLVSLRSQAKLLLQRCYPSVHQLLILPDHFREVGLISAEQYASVMKCWNGDVKSIAGDASRHPLGPWLGDQLLAQVPHRSVHVPLNGHADDEATSAPGLSEKVSTYNKKEQLTGKPILISRWRNIKISKVAAVSETPVQELLAKSESLWSIPPKHRGTVYQYLERRYIASTKLALSSIFAQLHDVVKELKVTRWQEDVNAVRESRARVIGCTTTGLTKYRRLIAALRPRVMMIEEAAETREANITAALFPSLEQIILVGDHMQLAPHADVLELSKPPFYLNVSLFQRLVERGLEHSTLQVQRRMAPDICRLLSAWYPLLTDHHSTLDREAVPGMGSKSVLWFDHQRPESSKRYCSKVNTFEADMIVGLYNHLVSNCTSPSEITILTFYSGQKACIENSLRQKLGIGCLGPEVQTVDGYQGRENSIILISITRSPEDRTRPDSGFLNDLRRAIVALSRPRHLLVILGDMGNLLASSARPIWSEVLNRMDASPADYIPVSCQAHGSEIRIRKPDEWERFAGKGGCSMLCGRTTGARGATCGRKCHGGSCQLAVSDMFTDRSATSNAQTFSKFAIAMRISSPPAQEDLIDLSNA